MNKSSYSNARAKRLKFVRDLPINSTKESHTEKGGRGGFNLQEMARDIDGIIPDEAWKIEEEKEEADMTKALDLLSELGDSLDCNDQPVYADFVDFLLLKIAVEIEKTPSQKFNDLLLKINSTDMPDINDTLKKITNIFSRTVLLELSNHGDLQAAQLSAYKKSLTRAEQYLNSGKMIKSADINQNPLIVAEKIKQVIDVLVARFSPESRIKSYPNLKHKIVNMNQTEIASKKSPGGAAIGIAISLIKNVLNGRDPSFINLVITNLARLL